MLLNLVIAVILENFSGSAGDEERQVPDEVLVQYREEWERLDPKATGNIESDLLMVLLRRVRYPLGFQITLKTGGHLLMTRTDQLHFIDEVNVPDHQGFVNFTELLSCLTRHAHREEAEEGAEPGSGLQQPPSLPPFVAKKLERELKAALKSTHVHDLN